MWTRRGPKNTPLFTYPLLCGTLYPECGHTRLFWTTLVPTFLFSTQFVNILNMGFSYLFSLYFTALKITVSNGQENIFVFASWLKTPKQNHFAKAQGKGRELLLLLVIIPRPSCHCLFGFQQPCAQQFFLSEPRLLVSKRVNRRHQGGIHQILRQVGRQLTNYVCRQ